MNALLLIIVTFGLALAALGLAWRGWAKSRPLPCPSWLTWMLENPYRTAAAGSATILERANLKPGMRVLGAGCGLGRLSIPMATRVGAEGLVVALDIQSAMLKKLKERAVAAGDSNILTVLGGQGTGLLKPGFFDRTVCRLAEEAGFRLENEHGTWVAYPLNFLK